jgi:hypothetical protein
MRLLSKDPAGRYPSALVLRDALENLRPGSSPPQPASASAGTGSGSASIPIVLPGPKPGKGVRIPRPLRRAPRKTWRLVFALTFVLVGIVAAFCFGETIQRLLPQFFKPNEQVVTQPVVKKEPGKSGSPGKRAGRSNKGRHAGRSPRNNSVSHNEGQSHKPDTPKVEKHETKDSTEPKTYDNPPDGSPERSDGADPASKSDSNNLSDTNG